MEVSRVNSSTEMTYSRPASDWWRVPALFAWFIFFSVGLGPEEFYATLRYWADVPTQRAMVNNPYMLMLAMVAYITFFTLGRCREAGLGPAETGEKAVHVLIVALAAFLPFPITSVLEIKYIPVAETRYVVIAITAGKALAWFHLWFMIVRYYTYARHAVFINMPVFLRSAREEMAQRIAAEQEAKTPASTSDTSSPSVEPFPPVTQDDDTAQ